MPAGAGRDSQWIQDAKRARKMGGRRRQVGGRSWEPDAATQTSMLPRCPAASRDPLRALYVAEGHEAFSTKSTSALPGFDTSPDWFGLKPKHSLLLDKLIDQSVFLDFQFVRLAV